MNELNYFVTIFVIIIFGSWFNEELFHFSRWKLSKHTSNINGSDFKIGDKPVM